MKQSTAFIVATSVGFAGLGLYFAAHFAQPPSAPARTGSNSAPPAVAALFAQSLPDSMGNVRALAKWKGRALVVNFWATWCAPCVEEMPALSALQEELGEKRVQIIGIGIDAPGNIRQFAARYKIAYPLYVGGLGGADLSRSLGNQAGGLPYTVLIDPDGRITKTYLGRLRMNELRQDITVR